MENLTEKEIVQKDERKEEGAKKKMTINDIREYIKEQKELARKMGKDFLVLRSGEIHKDLGLKNWMPPVCKAMYDCMEEGDVILHTTPKGNSSTIEIQYKL